MAKKNVARDILYPTAANILVRVAFLYVGQGASAVVFVADGDTYRVHLVDINLDRKAGGINVPPLMTDLLDGKALTAFVNTHPHDDHICGVKELSDAVDIEQVWHSDHKPSKDYGSKHGELLDLIAKVEKDHGKDNVLILLGSKTPLTCGDAEYHILAPAEYVKDDVNDEEPDKQRARIHEQCGVIKFGKDPNWILIVGDADKCAFENWITKYHKERLGAFCFAASHHGSRSFFVDEEGDDPYMEALEAIDPRYIVVSAPTQKLSRHKHPHDDAMEIYEEAVGKENVLHTGQDHKTFFFDIYTDGGVSGIQDDDGDLAAEYGFDDDDGEDGGKEQKAEASFGAFVSPRGQSGDYAPRKYGKLA